MTRTLAAFRRLSTAEEYLEFFDIPYDPAVVNVNRLHILKRFAGYMEQVDAAAGPEDTDAERRLERYREALLRAYRDFLAGTALDYRLFKVLKEHAPVALVPLSSLALTPAGGDAAGGAAAAAPEGAERRDAR